MLTDKAVLLSVKFSCLGNTRKLSPEDYECEADKEMLSATKRLLDSEEYEAIKSHFGAVRRLIAKFSLPADWIRSGMYMIPLPLIDRVEEVLNRASATTRDLVDKLCLSYEQRKSEASSRLKDLYNDGDYPDVEKVRASFKIEFQYLSVSVPDNLKAVQSEVFQREKAKASAQFAEALEDMKQLLRSQVQDLVSHMIDRITPGEDGRRKKFSKEMVEDFQETLGILELKNVGDDAELLEVIGRARTILAGKTTEQLKGDSELRQNVRVAFETLKSTVDTMVTVAPVRKILLPAEESVSATPA